MSCSSLEFLQACKTLICEALEETMKVRSWEEQIYTSIQTWLTLILLKMQIPVDIAPSFEVLNELNLGAFES
jgi:hypothetical protein